MTDERLDWFPCNPTKFLGALASMRAPEGYVYTVVLMRIYECGGACPDTLDALATRTRLNRRVVSEALDSLFRAGRLTREPGGIANPVATAVIADAHALREKRKHAGSEGASRRWGIRKQNQSPPHSKANAIAMAKDRQLQLQEQVEVVSLFPDGNSDVVNQRVRAREPGKPKRTAGTALSADWRPSEELIQYAVDLGLTRDEAAACGEEMRLWAVGNANRAVARKSNWDSTFQGWVRRAKPQILRNRPRGPTSGGNYAGSSASHNGHQPRGASAVLASVRRRLGESDRQQFGDPRDNDSPPPPTGYDDYGAGPRSGAGRTLDLRAHSRSER